jgi:hypothetical protein
MERHNSAADDLPNKKANYRPYNIGPENNRQSTIHDSRNLHIHSEPQCELTLRSAVPFVVRNHINRSLLNTATSPRSGWSRISMTNFILSTIWRGHHNSSYRATAMSLYSRPQGLHPSLNEIPIAPAG